MAQLTEQGAVFAIWILRGAVRAPRRLDAWGVKIGRSSAEGRARAPAIILVSLVAAVALGLATYALGGLVAAKLYARWH